MRRKDREVTDDSELLEILKECKVCRVAMVDGKTPYILPLNYGFRFKGGKLTLYFHSAKEGRKLDILSQNPIVAFEMDCGHRLVGEGEVPCRYGYAFRSIVGSGSASLVTDPEEKMAALSLLMEHQTGRRFAFDNAMCDTVAVFRIDAAEFCGKIRR
ncbi:MAG: pyridoxamine 5'-phosphate oxidase family protein [Oscillospiraceae bacterium]|nr:pyridoxamine 5'-phosphate oxidase family protein [Oscillospiraceae bacterium]